MSRLATTGSRSWLVAAGLVVVAGGVAWFGMSNAGSAAPAPHAPAVVETVAAVVAEDELAPAPQPKLEGALPTRLVVQRAGVDTSISEVGVAKEGGALIWEVAWHAVGHHMDSARPGQPGNMVLTGHVSVADRRNLAAFAGLNRVAAGDIVEVYSGDSVYKYSVSKVSVVAPSSVKLLRGDHNSTVTLITCTADLKNRLVVTATLLAPPVQEEPQPPAA